MPSKPPKVSTLPPAPVKRQRVAPGVELPSCGLPKPKRKKAKPSAKAPAVKKVASVPDTSPPWDGDKEAYLAKQAVLLKHMNDPIVAPEGAMVIPGVSKRAKTTATLVDGPMGGKLKRTRAEPAPPAAKAGKPATGERKSPVAMTDEIFAIVCGEIAEGVTLRQICRRPDMPSKSAVYAYLEEADDDARAGRLARYARARKLGYDALADEALEIVDDGTNDWIEREREDGTTYEALNGEHVQRSKLRFEARMKLLAVWDPRRYGNLLKLGDPDGKPMEQGNKSASDIAIDIAKLMVAAQREAGEAPGETLQ